MLTLPANPALVRAAQCDRGKQEQVVVLGNPLGDDGRDQRVGGQGQVVAVLLEAANRRYSHVG